MGKRCSGFYGLRFTREGDTRNIARVCGVGEDAQCADSCGHPSLATGALITTPGGSLVLPTQLPAGADERHQS